MCLVSPPQVTIGMSLLSGDPCFKTWVSGCLLCSGQPRTSDDFAILFWRLKLMGRGRDALDIGRYKGKVESLDEVSQKSIASLVCSLLWFSQLSSQLGTVFSSASVRFWKPKDTDDKLDVFHERIEFLIPLGLVSLTCEKGKVNEENRLGNEHTSAQITQDEDLELKNTARLRYFNSPCHIGAWLHNLY